MKKEREGGRSYWKTPRQLCRLKLPYCNILNSMEIVWLFSSCLHDILNSPQHWQIISFFFSDSTIWFYVCVSSPGPRNERKELEISTFLWVSCKTRSILWFCLFMLMFCWFILFSWGTFESAMARLAAGHVSVILHMIQPMWMVLFVGNGEGIGPLSNLGDFLREEGTDSDVPK